MRDVAIIGAGITPCRGRWVERTYYGLSQWAVKEAIADAKISIKDVDAVVFGIYNDIFELSAIPEHPLQGIIGMANISSLNSIVEGGNSMQVTPLEQNEAARG